MADSDSDDDDSAVRTPEQMVKLAQIFIIKINPEDNSIASIAPWDGTEPGINDRLVAYGVKISDRTYDAYTNVSSLIAQKMKKLEGNQSYHRTAEDKRTFDHLHAITETGALVSCLYGCQASRKPLPYKPPSAWGRTETLQDSLLPNLMNGRPRFKYDEKGIFRVYVEIVQDTKLPKSCWFSATGQDEWAEVPGYTKEVKLSELPSEIGDMGKNYRVLDRFLVDDACSYCFRREMGKFPENPFKRQKLEGGQKAGKSRRRLKRRFKRKTIKRINKRKTIKRRFKNR